MDELEELPVRNMRKICALNRLSRIIITGDSLKPARNLMMPLSWLSSFIYPAISARMKALVCSLLQVVVFVVVVVVAAFVAGSSSKLSTVAWNRSLEQAITCSRPNNKQLAVDNCQSSAHKRGKAKREKIAPPADDQPASQRVVPSQR